jgi:NAD+ kinase
MIHLPSSPENILVLAHPGIAEGLMLADEVAQFIRANGAASRAGSLYDQALRNDVEEKAYDVLIALGGDGTMLRAGHLCAPVGIPLLGINIGRFGFLVELKRSNWPAMLLRLLSGDYRLEERMMLSAACQRVGHEAKVWDVINDVVVARGQYVRPIQVEATLNSTHLASYVADGLIAATATGSTAYALAAGGPILPPELRNMLLMPVAPHLSIDRALVLSEGASVCIRVQTKHEAIVSVDGQEPVHLQSDDCVHVTGHEKSLRMIRFQDHSYFYRNLTTYMEHNPLFSIKPNESST